MRRSKHLLLWSSVGVLALLVWAAVQENWLQEWRNIQRAYKAKLPADRAAEFSVQLRQIVVPALAVTDRCVSCHVGMSPGEQGIREEKLFRSHPDVVHEPADFGCVVCHGGQGRATKKDDAHGQVAHWPEPMLPKGYYYAGCGTCHTHLAVPNLATLRRGKALFERYDCMACHALEGRGGTLRPEVKGKYLGPDLSRVGANTLGDWYRDHLARRKKAKEGLWLVSFGPIPEQDRRALEVYLSTRVGAPGLVEAKALFHTLGCRGCHMIGGVGGDDGPDLTRGGEKNPSRLDFTGVRGKRTVANWLAEHFRSPARVVPNSQMPYLGLSESDIRELTFYVLSLRRSDFPEAYWPKDRIRAERFAEREFSTDGATLYGTFCAACHGPQGQGMRYPGMSAFPAIGNPDFLMLASDEFIRETVRRGRPGRRMPAWGLKEGGLRLSEIDAVVSYVRALGGGIGPISDGRPPRWVRGDPKLGADLYKQICSACHGEKGEGGEGPALANPVLLETATDTYLVETIKRGRRGTSMRGFAKPSPAYRTLSQEEIESIVAFMRSWEKKP